MMSHFCPIWRSKMESKSLHRNTNSSLDFLIMRSNEKVRIPTGVLTVEQRLWWMVQSIVPNFICPASWMEAFLSSGRSARHGGHHCRDATLNGTQRSSWYWEDRHWQARLLEGSLKMRCCSEVGGLDTSCALIGFLPLFFANGSTFENQIISLSMMFWFVVTEKQKHDQLNVWTHLPMQCLFVIFTTFGIVDTYWRHQIYERDMKLCSKEKSFRT